MLSENISNNLYFQTKNKQKLNEKYQELEKASTEPLEHIIVNMKDSSNNYKYFNPTFSKSSKVLINYFKEINQALKIKIKFLISLYLNNKCINHFKYCIRPKNMEIKNYNFPKILLSYLIFLF